MASNKGGSITVLFSGTRLTPSGIIQKKAFDLAVAANDIDTRPDGFRLVCVVRSYVA